MNEMSFECTKLVLPLEFGQISNISGIIGKIIGWFDSLDKNTKKL